MEPAQPDGLNLAWAGVLQASDAAAVNHLRHLAGTEIAEAGEDLWIRGPREEGRLPKELARVPFRDLYALLAEDKVGALGSQVPIGSLPAGLSWKPVPEVFQPALSRRSLPAPQDRLPLPQLQLVRGGEVADPNLLRLPLETFSNWVTSAAQVRLSSLMFACSAEAEVLVWGRPLPALPGTRFVETEGLGVLAGWKWDPPLPASSLASALQLRPGDLALLSEGPTLELVPGNHFVPVSRAAVRQSPSSLATEELA